MSGREKPGAKIVCTIGPASAEEEGLGRLIEAGMSVARLNFSHGTHAEHQAVIQKIRRASAKRGRPVAILQDLEGPRLRIGPIREGSIHLSPLSFLTLSARPVPGDAREVSVSDPQLIRAVQAGDRILLNDGKVELRVEKVMEESVDCQVVVGGPLSSHKGINLPTRRIHIPAFTEKDRRNLNFGIQNGVDYVALSFVSAAGDILEAKEHLKGAAADVPVIAKIERYEALERLEEILEAADGVMIARGDLGVEVPLEKIPGVQKQIIRRANALGKPAITATQMLLSMVENPRPTRAEVTDVANAILDGTDAVMLSEETATGRYPVEAAATMRRIIEETEAGSQPLAGGEGRRSAGQEALPPEAACEAATRAARAIGAKGIAVFTRTGGTARLAAKFRPPVPILAFTPHEAVRRRMALLWGVVPQQMDLVRTPEQLMAALQELLIRGGYRPEDRFVILFGFPLDRQGPTNMIKLHTL